MIKIYTSWLVWAHFASMSLNIFAVSLGTFLAPVNFIFIFISGGYLLYTIRKIYINHDYPEESVTRIIIKEVIKEVEVIREVEPKINKKYI